MPAAENPPGARLSKPSWKDPRLLVGLLLVLASVAGVVALVDAADRTVEAYAATRTSSSGSTSASATPRAGT